jgi:hypothetical protein
MRRLFVGLAAIAALALITTAGWTQPPDGKDKGQKGGGKGDKAGGGRFQVGRVLPPGMREQLDLSAEQKRLIDELEKDVKDRLGKILTEEQKKKLEQMPGPGGSKGGPPDGKDGKDRSKSKGKDKDQGKDKDEPPTSTAAGGGVQWFATLERGQAEANRTGKPILFVAAAPHCGGISGMW